MRFISSSLFKMSVSAISGSAVASLFFLTAQTKALEARIPPSLQALSRVVEAKLKDDPVAYAEALLNIENYRDLLSPDMLPSRELSGALIVLYLSAEVRERHAEWARLLKRLEASSSSGSDQDPRLGLIKIAMETSNLEEMSGRFFEGVVENGKVPTTPELDSAVTELYPVGKLLSKQGILMGASELAKIRATLATLGEQFEKVGVKERLYRNLLVARSLWNTLALTWLAPTSWPSKEIGEVLISMQALNDKLSRPDKDFLAVAIAERFAVLEQKKKLIQKPQRLESILSAQREFAVLCNVREASIAADYVLQSYLMFNKAERQKLINAELFQNCFVGAKRYFPISRFDETRPQTPAGVYVPRPGLTAMTLFSISKTIGIPNHHVGAEKKIGPSTSFDDDLFHVWLDASQLLPTDLRIAVANDRLCTQKTLRGLCRQLAWKNTDTIGRRDFLLTGEGSRSLSALEREQLTYRTLVDAIFVPTLSQKRLARSIRADDRGRLQRELMRSLSEERATEYPAFSWYFENRDFLAIK